MSGSLFDAAISSRWSLPQRFTALKRIVPKADVARALRVAGKDRSFCSVMPAWLVVWFVVGLGLLHRDSYRQIFRHLIHHRPAPERKALAQ